MCAVLSFSEITEQPGLFEPPTTHADLSFPTTGIYDLWGNMTAMRFPAGAEIILPRRFAQIRSQDMKR